MFGSCFHRCFHTPRKGSGLEVLIKIMFTHKLWQINKVDGNRLRFTYRYGQSSKSLVVFNERTECKLRRAFQITPFLYFISSFLLLTACEAFCKFSGSKRDGKFRRLISVQLKQWLKRKEKEQIFRKSDSTSSFTFHN